MIAWESIPVVQKLPCICQSLGKTLSHNHPTWMYTHPRACVHDVPGTNWSRGFIKSLHKMGRNFPMRAFTGKELFPEVHSTEVFTVA